MTRLVKDHEYEIEVQRQFDWLNWIFSLATFTITLACLQFKTPWKPAALSLIVIAPMYWYAFKNIPASLKALRALRDETMNPSVVAEVKYLESKYHSWRAVVRLGMMFIVLILYFCVLVSSEAGWVTWLQS